MIRHIKLLRNIGTFNSDNSIESIDLKRVVLIYAENGRGKTTLAEILRSLATGAVDPIIGRRRLGSEHPPHIVFVCDGSPSNVMFQNDSWSRTLPDLKIFDDLFVDENVHSGLGVDPQHRQNLHELVLGDQGVKLSRTFQNLVSRNKEHNRELTAKGRAIPEQIRNGLSVDEFCALTQLPDIEDKIRTTKLALEASRNEQAVQTSALFEMLDLPAFDTQAIDQILSIDLPSLSKDAESLVHAHAARLGQGGEQWIAEGVRRGLQGTEENCPFCGQSVTGLALITHYRAYFSEGYARLKQDVTEMIDTIRGTHADGAQVEFERAVRIIGERRRIWAKFCDIPVIDIDTETIVKEWNAAREAVSECLEVKRAAPLEQQSLNKTAFNAINAYETHRKAIEDINKMLTSSNNEIRTVQNKAASTNPDEVAKELSLLNAIKTRHSPDIAQLCTDYIKEKEAKASTDADRKKERKALEQYRNSVFPKLQTGMNGYLARFNAGFRLDNFTPSNISGGSTCTYNVVINERSVAVAGGTASSDEPSFRNTLSAGDRNTLALALFFSSLDENPNLGNTIVVMDDPISSLDDHRSLTTIQAVRSLVGRTKQLVIMSHSKRFLCNIWDNSDQQNCVSLEIAQKGDESAMRVWNISEDAITEHDQRHIFLKEYAATQSGTITEVAKAIRPHLEGFLRVACPGNFPPGKLLGPFVEECRQKLNGPDEVLNKHKIQELQDIIEYGNRLHHVTDSALKTEHINATELLGFVKRTLTFCRPSNA